MLYKSIKRYSDSERSGLMFADSIQRYLKESGISEGSLAKQTGIPLARLSQCLGGRRKIKAEEYVLICDALGVLPSFFLKLEGGQSNAG